MSDKDKLVIIVFSFVFLVSFFFLLFTGPYPNGALFQYLFFIAALTMAFTGFLGATGTFSTKDQTLGGGAAIFIVMLLSVVGLKSFFACDDELAKLVQSVKTQNDKLSTTTDAIKYAIQVTEEYPKLKEKISELETNLGTETTKSKKIAEDSKKNLDSCKKETDKCRKEKISTRKLTLVVRSLETLRRLLPDEEVGLDGDNISGIQIQDGKYRIPLSDLRGILTIQLRNKNHKFGSDALTIQYDNSLPELPELQLYVTKVRE